MLEELFKPIYFDEDSLSKHVDLIPFFENWLLKNSGEKLSATFEEIFRGAFLEFMYIKRGALDDPVKYRDVKFANGFNELSGKRIDTKSTIVKKSTAALFPYIEMRLKSKINFFKDVGIDEAHYWYALENTTILHPWFRFLVKEQKFIHF